MGKKAHEKFANEIKDMLEEIDETQTDKIVEAAEIVSDCIKKDGIVHTFGTGHSHMIAEEAFFRAGTLAPVNAILEPSLTGQQQVIKSTYTERMEGWGEIILDYVDPDPKDVFIVISNSGRNAAPIELAQEAKVRSHKVIAITSKTYSENVPSRHSSGKKLMDIAELVIDNCGKLGDISVELEDLEPKVGPTSTITGVYILDSIMVQAESNLSKKMEEPPVFWSGNLPQGMEKNEKFMKKYKDRIHNW
ncbi:hypothetical protein AKJ63_01275 [candidate division MSBL1 archaeon SCGC-AAA259D18]|uniref:SIS domain-containing protein n=1 Tax=candidate division MSBL1 archaeon SCGC-AAA259D18 TaxID=1698262 RepID=A0A133UBI9_9EURY|nr:hypothetical protein AKJ63_01275 [candidate division MSBL1 archaeon SCGC-AAA259D18]